MSTEDRLDRLEASDAIRSLKMRYAKLCDAGYPVDELGPLFTDDAVWDGGEVFGRYDGRPAIEAFFATCTERVDFALHYTMSGHIVVDDGSRTASGTWYLWQPMTVDGQPVWLMATYDDRYVKVDGRWIYADLKLNVQALTPIKEGWAERRFIEA
jgi:hypothetical protein